MSERAYIRIGGDDRVAFLQGLLTQDVTKLNVDKIQFAALLSPQGKILHDMFLVAVDDAILIDTRAEYKDTLLKRLAMYKLRAKVEITDDPRIGLSDDPCAVPDPRHAYLPKRIYPFAVKCNVATDDPIIGSSDHPLGIPELGRDFAPDTLTALDAGYDLLNAVSFTKGCYVGQEVTARMHYKNIARRGFFILEREGKPERLALLKFEDVATAHHEVALDGTMYHARLPEWMAPKWAQWLANQSHPT